MKPLTEFVVLFLVTVCSLTRASAAVNDEILARLSGLENVIAEQKPHLNRLEELERRIGQQEEENLRLTRKLRNHVAKSVNSKNKDASEVVYNWEAAVADEVDSKVTAIFPRSCQEIYDTNTPASTSLSPATTTTSTPPPVTGSTAAYTGSTIPGPTPPGPKYHLIDPDGPAVGDPPFGVYCLGGTTLVGHDSEGDISATRCINEGCYTKTINYNLGATIRQMSTLIALSTECHQSFTYSCTAAYFEFPASNGTVVQYSWWLDRSGERRYFWAGKFIDAEKPFDQHTCQCGIDGKCEDTNYSCNCDIRFSLPTATRDTGLITEKNFLPMTVLKLGRVEGFGVFNIGKLECSGSKGNDILEPTSCRDLYQLGQTVNGFYTVKGIGANADNIETVFCNFRIPALNNGFETRFGTICTGCRAAKVQVYFNVQGFARNVAGQDVSINFSHQVLNEGNAMNRETGVFTAPVDGIYYFSFSGYKCPNHKTSIVFKLNYLKNVAMASSPSDASPLSSYAEKFSLESTLRLRRGDTLNLVLNGCIQEALSSDPKVTHFNGWLLEQE